MAKRDFWDKLNLQMACVMVAMWIGATAPSPAQLVPDLYRITDSVSRSHMEYHQLQVGKDQEVVLADLKGPGKVTYFYISRDDYTSVAFWYQEEPHQSFALQPFSERTALSLAAAYK